MGISLKSDSVNTRIADFLALQEKAGGSQKKLNQDQSEILVMAYLFESQT